MQALAFWKAVTVDDSNLLERFFELLRVRKVRFCLIGGQAVNAYAEPVVSLDLHVVVASERVADVEPLLCEQFNVERFQHSLNISAAGSDLRIQIQLDRRYGPFPDRARQARVLGIDLPVATAEDVLQGKVWAAQDPARRGSKRQKDLADIARLIEAQPQLRPLVPSDVLARLV